MRNTRWIRDAWQELRRHRLQTFLSALTMFIGVTAIVAVSAGAGIASDALLAQEEQRTGRAATYLGSTTIPPTDLATTSSTLADRLQHRVGDHGSALLSTTTYLFTTTDPALPASDGLAIEWDHGSLTAARRVIEVTGHLPDTTQAFPPALALNETAAAQLGYPPNTRIGLATEPGGPLTWFTITGMVADGDDKPQAYGTLSTLAALLPHTALDPVDIRITTGSNNLEAVRQIITDTLDDLTLATEHPVSRLDTTRQVLGQIQLTSTIFTAVSIIVLAIAGVGIGNIGLATLRERSRELVIRRAIGAHRSHIFSLVLSSTLMMAVIVAATAITIALAGTHLILPALLPANTAIAPPPFPWAACLAGCAAAITTAIAGSAAPAWKATRLPVASALRH